MAEQHTGVRDEHYDLVSVLYHTLQEADTIERYIHDARDRGDNDLATFFEQVQQEDRDRADRGKRLLSERIHASVG